MNKFQQMWVDFLKTGLLKAKVRLDIGGGQRCCLGHACHILQQELGIVVRNLLTFGLDYDGENAILPEKVAKALDITTDGKLTPKGINIARLFFRENHLLLGLKSFDLKLKLTTLNDESDISMASMGELIEMLFNNKGFLKFGADQTEEFE